MSKKFITPCFVAIKTEEEKEDLLSKLRLFGYEIVYNDVIPKYVVCKDCLAANDYYVQENIGENCGTNIDFFLALAAMTDKLEGINGEWWTYVGENCVVFKSRTLFKCVDVDSIGIKPYVTLEDPEKGTTVTWELLKFPYISFRKATTTEIVEHFNKK